MDNATNINRKREKHVGKINNKGFSVAIVLVFVVVVAAIGGAGYYVWHKHRTDNQVKRSSSQSTGTGHKNNSGTKTPTDPYAGWQTFTDLLYGYSFKYPTDWTLETSLVPQQDCDAGATTVTSPDKSVVVNYTNANNHDGGLELITTTSIDKLAVSGQDLSVIGSYSTNNTAYYPSYAVADSQWISDHPLTIAHAKPFPEPAEFTDQQTESFVCTGSFRAQPTASLTSEDAAKSWFTNDNAKESLLIIKSLSFNQ